MRSRASIKSHPLHPMLVAFPIAFFIGTFLADILTQVADLPSMPQVAWYLNIAGIGFALLAAVPGIIDYNYSVPPNSSAKKRATRHALFNITNILLFAVALYGRDNFQPVVIIVLEAAGLVMLSIAGWLGGTLVFRNQVGVDHRYAGAGKWNEVYIKDEGDPVRVADVGELKINQMKLVHIKDKRIVIANTENGYVAFDDHCTHRGASLADGTMICGKVQCPWHGSQFDTRTGQVASGPATRAISTYRLGESAGKILLYQQPVSAAVIH